ncbi:ABC transporter permease subunit, partial [Evtepia sp.]|uniref:ABC transporter permease subunit n=1 Tax=Evtepia sp. TaxID=2773933 RepID=UPI003F156F08
MNNLINFLTAGILAAAPLLFGVLGELLTEKSGNLNLGVEGMMFMGGIAGIVGPYYYEKAGGTNPYVALVIALVCALVCAGLGALVFSVLTITLRANQNVTGLALTMFGTGFGNYFGEAIGHADPSGFLSVSASVKSLFNSPVFPDPLVNLPVVGKLLFSHNFMVYLAVILAVILAYFL